MIALWTALGVLAAAGIVAVLNARIVPQTQAFVIERLGKYKTTWEKGFHIKVPVIDRIAKMVDLREHTADFQPWSMITKDSIIISIDTVAYLRIYNAMDYTYQMANPLRAIENLTATILRNIIGNLNLNDTLTSREQINKDACTELNKAANPWGVQVIRVEIQEIQPPQELQDAMQQKMRAERQVEANLLEAEGNAKAVRTEAAAKAEAIEMINKAAPGQAYLTLQSYETFGKVADGQATKIIVPTDIASMAGLAKGLTEVLSKDGEGTNNAQVTAD
jgi:regulator of protease activity HflC (stomatin/prohibitin superfamily)